jgi:hypothetical protein
MKEIRNVIVKLKNGKAVSFDRISNEMIKYSVDHMLPVLAKLFNMIYRSSLVPDAWKVGYITPLYKGKGDKDDPNNYRGITVTSCLGKVFSSVLNNQLISHFESKGLISD